MERPTAWISTATVEHSARSGGRRRSKVFIAPASLTTVQARNSRPSRYADARGAAGLVENDFFDFGANDNLAARLLYHRFD
jgi:hypothetical protein